MSEIKVVKNAVHTICADCCFANYEGHEQTGCKIDKLKDFKDIELCDSNLGKSYYVIDGENCQHKRSDDWMKDKENPEVVVEEEVDAQTTTFTSILLVQEATSDDQFLQFLSQIEKQTVQPVEIIVLLCHQTYPKRTWMIQKLNDLGIRWHIHTIPSKNVLDSIDLAVANCRSIYYTLFNPTDKIAPDFYEKFDKILRKEKQRFFGLEAINDKYSYCSIMSFCHNYFGGNKLVDTEKAYGEVKRLNFVLDKIKFICTDHEKEHFVKTNKEVGLLNE